MSEKICKTIYNILYSFVFSFIIIVSIPFSQASEDVLNTKELQHDSQKSVEVVPPTHVGEWKQQSALMNFTHEKHGRFLFLRQTQGSHAFQVSIPYRVKTSTMLVHLEFTNSNALLAKRSQIRLRMNGGVFAQAHLDPIFPDGSMDVQVPLGLLKSGMNVLNLEVAQHYLMECEDPGSPELWTSIDMKKSYIKVVGVVKDIQPQFSEVKHLLSDSGWLPQHITLLYTNSDQAHLHAGTLISQGIALKNQTQPAIIHSQLLEKLTGNIEDIKGDVILFGSRDELVNAMKLPDAKKDTIGQIFIRARANDSKHFIVVVVSSDIENLVPLAKAFALSSAPVGNQDIVQVYNVQSQTNAMKNYASHAAVIEGHSYKFSQVGYETTTLKGLQDQTHIDVWIPPGLFAESHMNVDLNLHFSYGASLRADSVLNILHNGKFIRGISLADKKGLSISDYNIRIPLASMRPGLNRFDFQSRMYAYTPSNCTTGNVENLLVTLFEDSTIHIPDAARLVAMPEINLLTTTGFPYTGIGASDSVIQVSSLSNAMMGAAWTLAARLAQVQEAIVEPLTVSLDAGEYKNVIRLSTIHDISPAWWAKAPINLGEKGFINHPTLANPDVLGDEISSWRLKLARLLDASMSDAPKYLKQGAYVRVREDVKLLNAAALMQMENPSYASGTLTLIVSDTEDELERAVRRLSLMWSKLSSVSGDLIIWGISAEPGQSDFWSASLHQNHYHIGSIPRWQRLSYFAIKYPWFLLTLLLSMFVLMSLITRWWLLSYRRKEHPAIDS